MSTVAADKLQVTCPSCAKNLMVGAHAAGKKGKCPGCGSTFRVPTLAVVEMVSDEAPTWENYGGDLNQLAALEQQAPALPRTYPVPSSIPEFPPQQRVAAQPKPGNDGGGFFAPEQKALSYGVVGGLALMGIAAAWFILGWMGGVIFFYPPILFLIGLFGFFKGLFSGNVAGQH